MTTDVQADHTQDDEDSKDRQGFPRDDPERHDRLYRYVANTVIVYERHLCIVFTDAEAVRLRKVPIQVLGGDAVTDCHRLPVNRILGEHGKTIGPLLGESSIRLGYHITLGGIYGDDIDRMAKVTSAADKNVTLGCQEYIAGIMHRYIKRGGQVLVQAVLSSERIDRQLGPGIG